VRPNGALRGSRNSGTALAFVARAAAIIDAAAAVERWTSVPSTYCVRLRQAWPSATWTPRSGPSISVS